MPYAMPNEALVDVLLPAYRCQHFGKCLEANWCPSKGHVPRGFLGATDALEKVEVVMVLAEPAKPNVSGCVKARLFGEQRRARSGDRRCR